MVLLMLLVLLVLQLVLLRLVVKLLEKVQAVQHCPDAENPWRVWNQERLRPWM